MAILRSYKSRLNRRSVLGFAGLLGVLVIQGAAITQSDLWAAPIVCLLLVAVAVDLPLVPVIGASLLVRVLTDDLSSSTSRHTSSVNLSALIAVVLLLIAIGLAARRRQAVWPAMLAAIWIGIWTMIAIRTHGESTVTIREGVREASIFAVALVVFNSRGVLNLSVVTRLIQLAGLLSALLAIYQLATHTGQLVGGQIRSNGTFAQPNGAAVFYAVATIASVWRFTAQGHRRSDLLFLTVFALATVSTFSLGGLACLLVMLISFGLLRPGSPRAKIGSCAVALLIVVGFLATPLGSERIASESSTNFTATGKRAAAGSSLEWRFDKWRTLLPEWERAPFFGQGLGTTTTSEGTSENNSAGTLPHSELVRYLVETGAIGLLTLLAGIIALVAGLARTRARLGPKSDAGTLGLAVALGLLVNALAANTLLYTCAAYSAALIVAAVLSEQAYEPTADA